MGFPCAQLEKNNAPCNSKLLTTTHIIVQNRSSARSHGARKADDFAQSRTLTTATSFETATLFVIPATAQVMLLITLVKSLLIRTARAWLPDQE
eukprot:1606334-Amphidinium_carterae.1